MRIILFIKFIFNYWREKVASLFTYIGGVLVLTVKSVFWAFIPPIRKRPILQQMERIGIEKIYIIVNFQKEKIIEYIQDEQCQRACRS